MTRLSTALLMSTLLSTGFALSAHAQSAPAPQPSAAVTPPQPAPPPVVVAPAVPVMPAPAPAAANDDTQAQAQAARERTMAADRNAMFEAHLAALHAGLTLTPDQDRLWPPVEQAMRGFVAMRADLRDRRGDRQQDHAYMTSHDGPIAALKVYSDGMLERAQALEALSNAAQPLYTSLSDDQKHRLPMLLRDLTPHRGPVARMIEEFDHERDHSRGDRMEHQGMGPRREQGHFGDRGWRGEDSADMGEGYDHPQHDDDRRAGLDDEDQRGGRWQRRGRDLNGQNRYQQDEGPDAND